MNILTGYLYFSNKILLLLICLLLQKIDYYKLKMIINLLLKEKKSKKVQAKLRKLKTWEIV